ncbi:hypothetical protein E5F92_002435 [Flavobacterium columnare]|uniref:hypothetical protein n=1 Tax=Flavobacterium columnare TaxID=996 RepID=UPI002989AB01|nr:hypothetical protein [Flavobacterium columnare]MCH4831608.1 hypothetical protein [Flavobacterium columnare]
MTPEERKRLLDEARELDRQEKETKAENIKALKELSEDFVKKHIDHLVEKHQSVEKIISQLFNEYCLIQELKAETYGNKVNQQDSHTSTLVDGSASITIGYNVSIGFDGTENEGVEKIREFINSLASLTMKMLKN